MSILYKIGDMVTYNYTVYDEDGSPTTWLYIGYISGVEIGRMDYAGTNPYRIEYKVSDDFGNVCRIWQYVLQDKITMKIGEHPNAHLYRYPV